MRDKDARPRGFKSGPGVGAVIATVPTGRRGWSVEAAARDHCHMMSGSLADGEPVLK